MGDQVAEISYGVIISEDAYNKLLAEAHTQEKHPKYNYEVDIPKKEYEGIKLEQPYETEDHLLVIEKSQESSFNGTSLIDIDFSTCDYQEWNNLINKVLTDFSIEAESKIGWLYDDGFDYGYDL